MTKREILDRLRGFYVICQRGDVKGYEKDRVLEVLIQNIKDDIREDETPAPPDHDGSEPVTSVHDVYRRLDGIYNHLVDTHGDTPARVMTRVLRDDIGDAIPMLTGQAAGIDHGAVTVVLPPGSKIRVEFPTPF